MAGFSHLFSSKLKNVPNDQRVPSSSEVLSGTAYNHKSDNISRLMHFLESPLWITKTDDFMQGESIGVYWSVGLLALLYNYDVVV